MIYRAKNGIFCTGKEYSASTGSKISYPVESSLIFHDSRTHEFINAKIYIVLLRRKYVGNITDILEKANHFQGNMESHTIYTQACTRLYFKATQNLECHTNLI